MARRLRSRPRSTSWDRSCRAGRSAATSSSTSTCRTATCGWRRATSQARAQPLRSWRPCFKACWPWSRVLKKRRTRCSRSSTWPSFAAASAQASPRCSAAESRTTGGWNTPTPVIRRRSCLVTARLVRSQPEARFSVFSRPRHFHSNASGSTPAPPFPGLQRWRHGGNGSRRSGIRHPPAGHLVTGLGRNTRRSLGGTPHGRGESVHRRRRPGRRRHDRCYSATDLAPSRPSAWGPARLDGSTRSTRVGRCRQAKHRPPLGQLGQGC